MCQKGFNLRGTHILGIGLVMKNDGATNPTDLGLLGSIGVVLQPHHIANLIQEFSGLRIDHKSGIFN